MLTTGYQLAAARALVGLEQTILAERSGLSVTTIRNMERAGAGPIAGRSANVQAVQRAMEGLGIEFLNHGEPGVRLRRPRPVAVDDGNPPGHTTDPDEADRGRFG